MDKETENLLERLGAATAAEHDFEKTKLKVTLRQIMSIDNLSETIERFGHQLVSSKQRDDMTDYEKVKALLTDFGVGFEDRQPCTDTGGCPHIICREGDAKVAGHTMFFIDFEFDKNGKFLKVGAWE